MEIKPINSYDAMSKLVAKIVAEQIINKPKMVLGFATGSTPLGMYGKLVKLYKKSK